MSTFEGVDLICFSHLRWNFVFQRPQHLMIRIARTNRVFFFEEPVFDDGMHYDVTKTAEGICLIVPHLSNAMSAEEIQEHQREFLSRFLINMNIRRYAVWYFTPMALPISENLDPLLRIYDCMDELSGFKFAPQAVKELEKKLMGMADIVFTGGYSLYEAKKNQHHNIHPFPSSIDYDHFSKARYSIQDPSDQECIPHPRFGFCGVIDERMNIGLLAEVAKQREDWHFVLIGPVVKINQADLPRQSNIHYLGMKNYNELPAYLAGWDVAIMPFALNESTRFISPTKTPEYLAAGKPVISTPINDVMRHYHTVVNFAATAEDFIKVAENDIEFDEVWLHHVDILLAENSWDKTWQRMKGLIDGVIIRANNRINVKNHQEYV
jgi:glycosyltransferase involved in cell wall biosynthesis